MAFSHIKRGEKNPMRHRILHLLACLFAVVAAFLVLAPSAAAQAQSNAGDLVGVVTDPQGALVPGAAVTARNVATSLTRTTTSDELGAYRLLVLPPGTYEVTVEAKGFTPVRNPEVRVQIGKVNEYNIQLELRPGQETVVVTTETELIETQRTAVAETITPREIQNLPINQRDYLNFTLLTSNSARDAAPSIGAAPTSGLNFGGQRARSNQVSVDGADATDNSINGVRSTVSQEAVQEFQIITNSYLPEFGRASGGIVNIVTRGGTNDFHGNIFGFIRNRHFEARNPFSTESDPAFTRAQAGVTFGGPIQKDRTFYFFSYEMRRREEMGFSSIGANNFGLVSTPCPVGAPGLLTPEQAAFVANAAVPLAVRAPYCGAAREASAVALTGFTTTGFPVFPSTGFLLPTSFVTLNALIGNYPVDEATSFWSGRIDHQWNPQNNFFLRVNVAPSTVRGIQVNAQNQTFGQNSWSRSSEQSFRDFALVAQNVTTFGSNWVNEGRFQFARRGLSYTPSRAPGRPGEPLGGEGLGVNIGGFAFFGREPFSRVDRVEKRWQWTDNVSWIRGRHTFKFGGDFNYIQISPRFENNQVFELNFGGVMNFGALSAGTLNPAFAAFGAPGFTAVQAYGLGIPQSFVQGIGDSEARFNIPVFALYAQDSWRLRPNLTLNYGVRWDMEVHPRIEPFNAFTAASEAAVGVTEGLPHDWNNIQPRIGFAWDPWNNGKSVIRAAYGLFFDHPPLATPFLSQTADGAQSSQLIIGPGLACATSILVNPGCYNAGSIFQGVLNAPANFGYIPTQQRFNPFNFNSVFNNQNYCPQPTPDPTRVCAGGVPLPILPFTFPVAADFVFGYAQQWNLTFERELAHDFSLSVGYLGVKGTHLNRPRNSNASDPFLLTRNFLAAQNAGCNPADPRFFSLTPCVTVAVLIPGIAAVNVNPGPFFGVPIVQPFAFNHFRASGPNFAFTGPLGVPDAALLSVASTFGFPTGPGSFIPFSDVIQQESTGSSIYHGLSVNLKKRFGQHYQFLASYTWSHAIDNSTDLQSLLAPQDNRNPQLERASSSFDQRHRFVFSAIFESPFDPASDNAWHKVFAHFTIAPIFEASSGRPFTVLTGSDTNLDFGPNTDRPSVVPEGTPGSVTSPFIPGVAFLPPTVCPFPNRTTFGCTGNSGRNLFNRPEIWNLDLRVARKFPIGERWSVDAIVDIFNVFNRFNVADVNPLCNPLGGAASCIAGQPTAALDTRQFQFGVKVNW